MPRTRPLAFLLFLCVAQSSARACLWDYDTLRDERRGLPGMAEILAGQWEKHSAFSYHHRVAAMQAKLAAHPDDWDAMDNLAVAYEKLDDRDAAIAVMLDKDRRHPNQYTTYANLGTFYIHKGDLDDGIAYIKRALAINPDAHFGREEYQLRLAGLLKAAAAHPEVRDDDFLKMRTGKFKEPDGSPVLRDDGTPYRDEFFLGSMSPARLEDYGLKPNVFDGIVGMIRFGTNNSPDLYFALGDVLAARGDKNLAFRAYQRALDLGYPRPAVVRQAMKKISELQLTKGGLDPKVITAERDAGARWVADYQQFEDGLVRAGGDTDDEANFAPFYATHPRTLGTPDLFLSDVSGPDSRTILLWSTIAAMVSAVVFAAVRRARRRWRERAGQRAGTAAVAPAVQRVQG